MTIKWLLSTFLLCLELNCQTLVLKNQGTIAINSFDKISAPLLNNLKARNSNEEWYSLTIDDQSIEVWVLEFVDFRIDHIEMYIPKTDVNSYDQYKTGDAFDFDTRPIHHKNIVFNLPIKPQKKYTLYFKVVKNNAATFVLKANLRTLNNFAVYGFAEYAFLSFFYGILFCMFLYNLFHYFFTKDKLHLQYVGYVTSLSLFSLSRIDGLGFQYIWPKLPILNTFLFSLSLALFMASTLGFSAYFLNLKQTHKKYFRLLFGYSVFRIFYSVLTLWIISIPDIKIIDLIFFISVLRKGMNQKALMATPIRFFLAAYACMISGFTLYTLQDLEWIPNSFVIYYALNLGVLTESILLSMALSEKTKDIILIKNAAQQNVISQLETNKSLQQQLIQELQEKEALKDKVNQELSQKVRERTFELEEKNNLLIVQKQKIESLASQIDIQYHSFKKESYKKELKYVWNKFQSYEEFHSLYPTEFSCLKYLENEKWQNKFTCTKCNHNQFSINQMTLSRKCNRCSHIESVTANTIYHGIHFPIQKAMYLVHCVIHSSDSLNISSLSRDIDLRLNTTRAFVIKVRESMRKK